MPSERRISSRCSLAFIGFTAVVFWGTALTFFATQGGLGLTPDGVFYVDSARNFFSGSAFISQTLDGTTVKVNHWPPLYPAILAVVGVFNDPYVAGRWLHLCFPFITGLLCWLIIYQNKGSHLYAFLGTSAILFAPRITGLNWFAFSEPLFFILQLLVLWMVSRYLHHGRRILIAGATAFVALAALTRYAGIAMVPALAFIIWKTVPNRSSIQKHTQRILYPLLAVLPVMLFVLFWRSGGGAIFDRSFAWHPTDLFDLAVGIKTFVAYLSPQWASGKSGIIYVIGEGILLFCLVVWQVKRQIQYRPPPETHYLKLFIGVCVFFHLFILVATNSFLDGTTLLDPRQLSPVYVWVVLLIALMGPDPSHSEKESDHKTAWCLFVSICAVLIMHVTSSTYMAFRANPIDPWYSSSRWRNSPTLAHLQSLPDKPWIISNEPSPIIHYARTQVTMLPLFYNPVEESVNSEYAASMLSLRESIHRRKGLLVYFTFFSGHNMFLKIAPSLNECIDLLDLEIAYRFKDGVILQPHK